MPRMRRLRSVRRPAAARSLKEAPRPMIATGALRRSCQTSRGTFAAIQRGEEDEERGINFQSLLSHADTVAAQIIKLVYRATLEQQQDKTKRSKQRRVSHQRRTVDSNEGAVRLLHKILPGKLIYNTVIFLELCTWNILG